MYVHKKRLELALVHPSYAATPIGDQCVGPCKFRDKWVPAVPSVEIGKAPGPAWEVEVCAYKRCKESMDARRHELVVIQRSGDRELKMPAPELATGPDYEDEDQKQLHEALIPIKRFLGPRRQQPSGRAGVSESSLFGLLEMQSRSS